MSSYSKISCSPFYSSHATFNCFSTGSIPTVPSSYVPNATAFNVIVKMMGESYRTQLHSAATTGRHGAQHSNKDFYAVPHEGAHTTNYLKHTANHFRRFGTTENTLKTSGPVALDVKTKSRQNAKPDNNKNLDYTTTTGSSSSNSGIEYKRRHLPSITTTSDTTPSECYSNQDEIIYCTNSLGTSGSAVNDGEEINYQYLYARSSNSTATSSSLLPIPQAPPLPLRNEQRRASNKEPTISQKSHQNVRRVASFTYSSEESIDKHNKRNNPHNSTTNANTRKLTLVGKTFNYLKNKMDTAISTSALYPTVEECRLWQDSFEALLNHKCKQL